MTDTGTIMTIVTTACASLAWLRAESVGPETSLDDLGFDSLDWIELAMLLEKHIKDARLADSLALDFDSVHGRLTVAALARLVEQAVTAARQAA